MKINLGCGGKRKEGYLGLDKFEGDAVDLRADLEGGFPLASDSVDEVWSDNFIEHVRDVPALMSEIHRVCRDGARVTLLTPHFSSLASWRDPTHVQHFSYFTLDYFAREDPRGDVGGGFRILDRRLSFVGGPMGLVAKAMFTVSPRRYEERWAFVFRASTLRFELEVRKGRREG